jgi:hypothetical protein
MQRVPSQQENQLCQWILVMELVHRIDRKMRWRAINIDPGELKERVAGDGSLQHFQAPIQRRNPVRHFMGWSRSEDPQDPIQAKLVLGFSSQDQVTDVGWIKSSAKDAQG